MRGGVLEVLSVPMEDCPSVIRPDSKETITRYDSALYVVGHRM